MANPPVNTKETNPLQGMVQSKIDFYGLGEIVRKLRGSNVSYIDIAKEINENHLQGDCPKVSTMAVQRWCKKNIKGDTDLRENEETAVNVYLEKCIDLDMIKEQIEIIRLYLDQYSKEVDNGIDVFTVAGKTKDLLFLLEKLLARKQSLLNDIGVIQEKVYSYMAVTEIIRQTLEIVKQSDIMIYADVMEKLQSNQVIKEAYKRIKPE